MGEICVRCGTVIKTWNVIWTKDKDSKWKPYCNKCTKPTINLKEMDRKERKQYRKEMSKGRIEYWKQIEIDKEKQRLKKMKENHERRLINERIDKNIESIKIQVWQWKHGLYMDIIKDHILEWIDLVKSDFSTLLMHDLEYEEWSKTHDVGTFDWFKTPKRQEWYNAFSHEIYSYIGVFRMYIYPRHSNLRKHTLDEIIIGKQLLNGLEIVIKEMIRDYKPIVKVIKEVREVVLTVREKPKPKPKSTKFICFNCDTEYDNPIKVCEKCGFEFKK